MLKKARAGDSAKKLADMIFLDVLLPLLLIILFSVCYVSILYVSEPWPFNPWFIFLPAIIIIIAIINLPLIFLARHKKVYIEYDINSIRYYKQDVLEWEITKDVIEQIEYSTPFPYICSNIKIRCHEKINYLKKSIILTAYTIKKLSKNYGYPISKV